MSRFLAPEFALGDAEFERIRALIERRTGIQIAPSRRGMVYNRLNNRLRQSGCRDFAQYLDSVEQTDSKEAELFVNALTTNLTAFFREAHHFPILAAFLRERTSQSRATTVWSAAASTGEEAYSIAMTAIDTLGKDPRVRIVASDIDTRVLATASDGNYPIDAVVKVPREQLRKHFFRGVGDNAGRVRVRPELRRLVEFTAVNLAGDDWGWREPFDAVFCRNVMIYFDRPTRNALIEALHRVIRPDGLLFVGHSETFGDHRDLFAPSGLTVYRRLPTGATR